MAAHTAHTTHQLRMGKIYVKEVGDDVSGKDGYQAKLNFSPLNDGYASKLITMNYTWHSARAYVRFPPCTPKQRIASYLTSNNRISLAFSIPAIKNRPRFYRIVAREPGTFFVR